MLGLGLGLTSAGVVDGSHVGPELLTNGGFDADTDWDKTNATIAAGVATITGAASGSVAQAFAFTPGAVYRVRFTVTAYTAGVVRPQLLGGTTISGTNRAAVGDYTSYLTAVTGNDTLRMFGGTTPNLAVDNVSLRLVIP
jgi:hypothetical protein